MNDTTENIEDSERFKLGKKHGGDDRASGMDSDMGWFKRSGFYDKDSAYCAGYELGYLEGNKGRAKKKY